MTSLDLTAESMWEELEASRTKIERMFAELRDMIGRYQTWYFDPGAKGKRELGNPAFEILSTMQSQICAGDPSFVIDPQRSDDPTITVRTIGLQYSVNRVVREIKLKRTLQKALVDFFFRRAVLVTERQVQLWADRGPLDGAPYRPDVKNVGMWDFRYDPRTKDMRERRWSAHRSLVSKGTILERIKRDPDEKGWYTDIIADLKVEQNLEEVIAKDGECLKRDDFVLWSVWIPDEQVDENLGPKEGFWGSWHYYAQTGTNKDRKKGPKKAPLTEIREPQPCFTSRTGPYTIIGQFDVPDEAEPLSLLVATEAVSREMGSATKTILGLIRAYKRIMVYSGSDPSLARKMMSAQHGSAFHSSNFDPTKAAAYELAGVNEPTMAAFRWLTEQFWKASGMTEAMLGQSATGATATADTLAAGGAQSRVALLRGAFHDGVGEVGCSLAEIIDTDDRFFMRVPPAVQQQTGITMTAIRGGRKDGQSFDDYDVRLMPVWMRYRSEEEIAQAAEIELNYWERFAAVAPTSPYLNWKDINRDRAMQTQRPNLDARVNYDMLEQVSGILLQGMIQAGSGAGQTNSPPSAPVSAQGSGATPKLQSVGAKSKPASPSKGSTFGDKAGRTASKMATSAKVA